MKRLMYRIDEGERVPCEDPETAHLISSRVAGKEGYHAPVLDLDIPHRYVPSATEGHGHLYLDVELPRWRYEDLLLTLSKYGIIEEGYAKASIARNATYVRSPNFPKGGPDTPELKGTAAHMEEYREAPLPAENFDPVLGF